MAAIPLECVDGVYQGFQPALVDHADAVLYYSAQRRGKWFILFDPALAGHQAAQFVLRSYLVAELGRLQAENPFSLLGNLTVLKASLADMGLQVVRGAEYAA